MSLDSVIGYSCFAIRGTLSLTFFFIPCRPLVHVVAQPGLSSMTLLWLSTCCPFRLHLSSSGHLSVWLPCPPVISSVYLIQKSRTDLCLSSGPRDSNIFSWRNVPPILGVPATDNRFPALPALLEVSHHRFCLTTLPSTTQSVTMAPKPSSKASACGSILTRFHHFFILYRVLARPKSNLL